jgi:hypothetical protein
MKLQIKSSRDKKKQGRRQELTKLGQTAITPAST